jgi:hypothetical protein
MMNTSILLLLLLLLLVVRIIMVKPKSFLVVYSLFDYFLTMDIHSLLSCQRIHVPK